MPQLPGIPAPAAPAERDYWPTADWRASLAEDHGMDAATLERMHQHVGAKLPHIRSILVIRHGYLVFEQYYQGCDRNNEHEVASVTKSFISALVGIALKEGRLDNLDQHMMVFFAEYQASGVHPQARGCFLS